MPMDAVADEAPCRLRRTTLRSPSASMAGLGNLAQSARGKELKSARMIMFFVGVLSVAVNMFVFSSAEGTCRRRSTRRSPSWARGSWSTRRRSRS